MTIAYTETNWDATITASYKRTIAQTADNRLFLKLFLPASNYNYLFPPATAVTGGLTSPTAAEMMDGSPTYTLEFCNDAMDACIDAMKVENQNLVVVNSADTDSQHYELKITLPDVAFDPLSVAADNGDNAATLKITIPNYPAPVNARPIQYDSNNADPNLFLA